MEQFNALMDRRLFEFRILTYPQAIHAAMYHNTHLPEDAESIPMTQYMPIQPEPDKPTDGPDPITQMKERIFWATMKAKAKEAEEKAARKVS